jgi:hypothetical protein
MSAEIEVPDGPEACGPTCAIQLLGVEIQDATRETEVTLPNRPALSCFGSGASQVTIHRPTRTAARVHVTRGGAR